MNSNLMCPSRLQYDTEERAVDGAAQRCDGGQRALAVPADAERDRTDARDGSIDRLRLRELVLAEREITLSNLLRFELPRESRVDIRAFREKDHAARAAIESLHEEEMPGVCHRQLEKDRLVGIVSALDHDVRRFVDEEQIFILVKNLEHRV